MIKSFGPIKEWSPNFAMTSHLSCRVEFMDVRDAQKAIETLDGTYIQVI